MGLCVIGNHEPCFSVSTFFSKDDENYKSQYEKFSSLLSGLKEQVEEAELNKKGGEQPMNEFENIEAPVEETPVEETPAPAEEAPAAEETPVEEVPVEEPVEEETPAEETPAEEPVDFEALQAQIETLQNSNNELTTNYENAQARIAELEQALANANASFETATARITELETSVAEYAAERAHVEEENKNNLIEKYAKVIDEEEISAIRAEVNNFSYSELESKLAITFANKQMAGSEESIVPQPEPVVEDEFAMFMKKYRKN